MDEKLKNELIYVPLNKDGEDDDDSLGILHGVHRPRENNSREPKYKLLVAAVILLLLLSFALSTALAVVLSRQGHADPRHMRFSHETKKIERLQESNPDAVNDTWNCLPNQNGLVYLDREKERLTQDGLPSGDGHSNLYGIGWMHQIYCLALFRNSLYSLLYQGSVSPWGQFTRQDGLQTGGVQAHIDDCFDYVRQKILCAGDMTIEGAAETSDKDPLGGAHHIDGFGGTVTCLDKVGIFHADDAVLETNQQL
jgi:hypothetical protein